jgi:hypothetical protein
MGMGLFYVTVFTIFFLGGGGAAIGGFAAFFEGVLRKAPFLVWFFAGEFVVRCVVDVDRRHHAAWRLKTCHYFEIYFRVCCGKRQGIGSLWEWRTEVPGAPLVLGLVWWLADAIVEAVLIAEERMLPCTTG